MTRLSARIGMWAAIAQTAFSLIYLAGVVILMAALFSQKSMAEVAATRWTNIQDFAAHYTDNPLSMHVGTAVQVDIFLSGLAILVIFNVLHEIAKPEVKIITRICSALALIVVVLSCTAYYIQLASVHQTIINGGDLEGLGQFAESNFSSPGMATMQLSWAFFYGLTTLVGAAIFTGKGIEKWIKWAFMINGLIGIIVGSAYAFGVTWLLPLSMLSLIVTAFAYPLLAIYFKRLDYVHQPSSNVDR